VSDPRYPDCRIHPTAIIESDVVLGSGTAVWDTVHIRRGASVGRSCIIGEKTYIAYEVQIGDFCKINSAVYVCAGVSIEDHVMIAAHTVFTNDRFPRSFERDPVDLAPSEPTSDTLHTRVARGVTISANATIGPGLTLAEFAMIGMGGVVTRDVPPHILAVGNPASPVACVCVCGHLLVRLNDWLKAEPNQRYSCEVCQRQFQKNSVSGEELGDRAVSGGAETLR
jgi:acetyltransferase-like isoleucine patch superfamily enzyme